MSLFNETNQLGREVSELKKLVKSIDTKVKQLQKRVQEKSDVEIEHEDVESRVYSPHEVVVKTRKGIYWTIVAPRIGGMLFMLSPNIIGNGDADGEGDGEKVELTIGSKVLNL
ncbi:hypothetical protein M3Y96_00920500 [Aphelenchoides besseyi]|nr:hypothetical protein M3Y96_00920500 [Aphelenchoides besseyi]